MTCHPSTLAKYCYAYYSNRILTIRSRDTEILDKYNIPQMSWISGIYSYVYYLVLELNLQMCSTTKLICIDTMRPGE